MSSIEIFLINLFIVISGVGCNIQISENRLAEIEVLNLKCEQHINPLGVDKFTPRFSWMVESDQRGERQVAYQLLVASSLDKLNCEDADMWNSGEVESDQSLNVTYRGDALKSRTKYFWKVRILNSNEAMSEWSNPAFWSMGVMSQNEWQGEWIQSDLELFDYQKELMKIADHNIETEADMWARSKSIIQRVEKVTEAPAVWLRKEFKAEKRKLRSATLFISGLGLYEPYLNGSKINDHLLTVSPHDFDKKVPYHVYDVTKFIGEDENTLGVILGNGYYNPVVPSLLREYAADYINTPRLRCELKLEFEDESTQLILSDSSWKFTTDGPIRFNSIRSGETYDARSELGEWSTVGFNDNRWKPAREAKGPKGDLVQRALPPVRLIKTIPAVSVEEHESGYRFDIGVESTGWARIKLRGERGQKIVIRYPGSDTHTLGRYQTYEYICKGEGDEFYEPRFAFNGYRYVDVIGLNYNPEVTDLVGCQIVSDLQNSGTFSCSDSRINYLNEVSRRTIRNYHVQMPMDPVREKVCWTQDVQSNFEAAVYNYNMYSIYEKWQDDYIDGMLPNGYIPAVVPSCFDGPTINGPWWGGMLIYNPWQIYNFYGDKEILVKSYDAMKQHFAYLGSISEGNIIKWGLGDWMDIAGGGHGRPKGTSVSYTSTCAYMMYADILLQTAQILEQTSEVDYYAACKEEIRGSINEMFYSRNSGVYDKGSQTAYILALKLNIMETSERQRTIENLREQIATDNNHLSTGFVGTPFLLTILSEEGLADLAWKIATQDSYPSWNDMIYNRNNSVFKENWQGGLVQMPSLAGPIGVWFYRTLGGIRAASPGFKTITIQPFIETLEWVNCVYKSPYGTIESNWKKRDNILMMNVVIPANTTATVYVSGEDVKESGISVKNSEAIEFIKYYKGSNIFRLKSGEYNFTSKIEE